MANNIENLEKLPDIDLLSDEEISLENIIEEMIADYQLAYEELTKEEKTLYPASEERLMINVVAGEIFQAYEFAQERFKENFIRYMNDDELLNWGGNIGYELPEKKAAVTILEFIINDPLEFDVVVPNATRVTAGDDIYFETDVEAVISAGELTTMVSATCTEVGTRGNDYAPGQISIIADPFPYMGSVTNTIMSSGGEDAPEGDDLREQIYLHPSTYSVAGPKDAYIALVKKYSAEIADVAIMTDEEAVVNIYVMLKNGIFPNDKYLSEVADYIKAEKRTPETDRFVFHAPEVVAYALDITYYIESSDKDNEKMIKESVEEAIEAFSQYQYSKIGLDIDSGVLVEYVRAAGAKRAEIRSPVTYRKIEYNQIAVCNSINLVYGGLEG